MEDQYHPARRLLDQNFTVFDEIYTFKGKQYHPSNPQPFTGRAVSRHANGKLRVETVYEDGIRRTRREWDENGNLIYGGE